LMVVNALVHHPELFSNYMAIDPSLWWDENLVLHQAKEALTKQDYADKLMFVGVANTFDASLTYESIEADTTEDTEHIRAILSFSKAAEKKTPSKLQFDWKYYPNEDHGSVPFINEYDALHFLFSWYKYEGWDHFYSDDTTSSSEQLLEPVLAYYKLLSSRLGYEVLPDESKINEIGYLYIAKEEYERAEAFLQLNVNNFPESSNAHDSMGDWYVAVGKNEDAKKSFSKAVEIDGSPGSKTKLDELN